MTLNVTTNHTTSCPDYERNSVNDPFRMPDQQHGTLFHMN